MKKLISILLILAMMMAAGATAFADGTPLMNNVLNALGNGVYRTTYEALQGGETIKNGSYGATAKGVQQTLADFGENISADGSVGSKTIEALQHVQKSFGIGKTDKVDAYVYERLLVRLLLMKDQEAAGEILLGDDSPFRSFEEFQYSIGGAYYQMGKYYDAQRQFLLSEYADYKDRAESCVQSMPSTGVLWKNSSMGNGTQLTIQVNNADGEHMFVKIYAPNKVLAATLFINGSSKATVNLPGGTYTIKTGTGDVWFGPEDAFGDDGNYETMTFENGSSSTKLDAGYAYALTINVVESDPEGEGVGSFYTDREDF